MMTRPSLATLLVLALWATDSPNLSAQVFYGKITRTARPVVVATPQQSQPSPRFPRFYNFLQIVNEPSTLVSQMPYPGYQPSPYALLDSSPQFANIAFTALTVLRNTTVNWIGFGVPSILRVVRVVMYGPPTGIDAMPGNTLLWIASPFAAKARLNWAARGHFFNPPVMHRPLFPRLHAWRHGYHCECR